MVHRVERRVHEPERAFADVGAGLVGQRDNGSPLGRAGASSSNDEQRRSAANGDNNQNAAIECGVVGDIGDSPAVSPNPL